MEIREQIERLEEAVSLKSSDTDLWNRLGLAYRDSGMIDKAIECLQHSLQLNSTLFETWVHLGTTFKQQGDIKKSLDYWQHAAKLQPENADLHTNIAILLQKSGNLKEAAIYYHQAITFRPAIAEIHCNLGLTLCGLNRFDEAIVHFKEAIRLKRDLAEAHLNLGMVYFTQGKYDDALACAQQSLVYKPDNANAYFNIGNILKNLGRYSEATAYYERALQWTPNHADACFQLGHTLQLLNRSDEAIAWYKKAIILKPSIIEAYNNWGNICKRRGRISEALELYNKALSVDPDYAPAYCNMGLIYQDQFNLSEAVNCFKKAIVANPAMFEANENLADTLLSEGLTSEGIKQYEKALKIRPSSDGVRVKIATALPRIYQSTEELLYWRNRYVENLKNLQQQTLNIENPVSEAGTITFFLAYHGLNDRNIQQDVAQLFSGLDIWNKLQQPLSQNLSKNRKPRIGIVSRYFMKTHTIFKVFMGILEHLSRDLFEIVIFTVGSPGKLPINAEHTHINLSLNNLSSASEAIARQNLDLLLYTDIGMDPLTYYLGFLRLAPVQCVTWGHPVTTGMETIDYYISSRLFETDESHNHYTEKLVQLNSIPTYFYKLEFEKNPKFSREHFGFTQKDHIYLSPQSLFKFHPDFDETLGAILRSDPDGILILANAAYKEWNPLIMKRFESRIPDIASRIRIFAGMDHEEFLNLISLADVMLDTTHFGGGRSTYESLSLGTPIVTMPSQLMRGRMTYGCYQKMGITETVASSSEEYIDIALRLATDPEYRNSVKSRIIKANHILYEDIDVVHELESFFLKALEGQVEL